MIKRHAMVKWGSCHHKFELQMKDMSLNSMKQLQIKQQASNTKRLMHLELGCFSCNAVEKKSICKIIACIHVQCNLCKQVNKLLTVMQKEMSINKNDRNDCRLERKENTLNHTFRGQTSKSFILKLSREKKWKCWKFWTS